MISIKLKDLLRDTFSPNELNFLDKKTLNSIVQLEELIDLKKFIKECEIETKKPKISGSHRIEDWENGWSGKGVYYSGGKYNNLPFYFKNNTHIRINNRVFQDKKGFAEVDLLRALQVIIFKKYLNFFDSKTVCEYGCGTGSNIQFLRNKIISLNFYGTDWAKSACQMLIKNKILNHDKVFRTDYFDSSTFFSPPVKYLAFTNASLEQTGRNYEQFMMYLFEKDTCLGGIHIEPIKELLDLDFEINQQSFDYSKKRGYLDGFLRFMKSFSKIEIICAKDYGIGSKYINGYQVLCWKKI